MTVFAIHGKAVRLLAVLVAVSLAGWFAAPAVVRAAPTQAAPSVHLKPLGTLGATTIPLLVSWPKPGLYGVALSRFELEVSRDGGAWTPITLTRPRYRSATVWQTPGAVLAFRVRAVDAASQASEWAQSASLSLSVVQETDSNVALSTGWQLISRTSAYGGWRAVTTQSAQQALFWFTGREVGWVARKGRDAGTAQVSIDGGTPASVSLYRSSSASRRIVFTAILPSSAAHTLTLTTQTAGAKVDVDAFVVLADPSTPEPPTPPPTPPPTAPPTETLIGAGDIATCGNDNDSATAAVAASVPGTVFTAGDNVYPDGQAANYTNCYEPSWGTLKDRTRPVLGNHDYYNSPGAAAYFSYFGASAGDPSTGWYSYDAGSWRVYVVNSECNSTTCPQQYAWLQSDLAAYPLQCTLAIWHRPRFSSGPHGDAAGMDSIWRLLASAGNEVVLNGHDHNYQRYAPLDADGNPAAAGMREFVVGTGGASHYNFVLDDSRIEARDSTSYGVLRLDLSAGSYSWQFLPAGVGAFTDSGTTACH